MAKRADKRKAASGSEGASGPRPRWAKELTGTQWTKVETLIDDGYAAADIARIAKLPTGKLRSLQLHVRKCGPKRRLLLFAKFKDALLRKVDAFGEKFSDALSTIAELAVDPETDPKLQVRAIEAMTQFTDKMAKMMERDAAAEEKRTSEERGRNETIDPSDVVRSVLEHYGVNVDNK